MGLMAALALTLNFLENMIPALPAMPPGVKLGLSNIAVVYCLFFWGGREALFLAVLKSGFVLLTRGAAAGCISLAGGLLSLGAMALAIRLAGKGGSRYFAVSIPGAVCHNLGQLLAAAALMKNAAVFYSLPVLILAGILMGTATAVLLRAVMPALRRLAPPGKGK